MTSGLLHAGNRVQVYTRPSSWWLISFSWPLLSSDGRLSGGWKKHRAATVPFCWKGIKSEEGGVIWDLKPAADRAVQLVTVIVYHNEGCWQRQASEHNADGSADSKEIMKGHLVVWLNRAVFYANGDVTFLGFAKCRNQNQFWLWHLEIKLEIWHAAIKNSSVAIYRF